MNADVSNHLSKSLSGGPDELIDRLRLQVGRLDIVADEFEGRTQRSALFKTMFLAFRSAGAKDWRSNLTIALDHSGAQHKLQFHHVFPKAVLTKNGYTARQADDIANLSFIGGKTNRAISDKPPSDYLPPLIVKNGRHLFDAQCIPTDAELLQVGSYKSPTGGTKSPSASTPFSGQLTAPWPRRVEMQFGTTRCCGGKVAASPFIKKS